MEALQEKETIFEIGDLSAFGTGKLECFFQKRYGKLWFGLENKKPKLEEKEVNQTLYFSYIDLQEKTLLVEIQGHIVKADVFSTGSGLHFMFFNKWESPTFVTVFGTKIKGTGDFLAIRSDHLTGFSYGASSGQSLGTCRIIQEK